MRKFSLVHILAVAAGGVFLLAGVLAATGSPSLQLAPSAPTATAATPIWSADGSQVTLAIGESVDFSLAPTAENCRAWQSALGVADSATLREQSPATAPVAARETRYGWMDQPGGTPYRVRYAPFGSINGITPFHHGGAIWLRGRPHGPITGWLLFYYPRTCWYSTSHKPLENPIRIAFSGTAQANGNSPTSNSDAVSSADLDALTLGVAESQCLALRRLYNTHPHWDPERIAPPLAAGPARLLETVLPEHRQHCCIAADVNHNADRCFNPPPAPAPQPDDASDASDAGE